MVQETPACPRFGLRLFDTVAFGGVMTMLCSWVKNVAKVSHKTAIIAVGCSTFDGYVTYVCECS